MGDACDGARVRLSAFCVQRCGFGTEASASVRLAVAGVLFQFSYPMWPIGLRDARQDRVEMPVPSPSPILDGINRQQVSLFAGFHAAGDRPRMLIREFGVTGQMSILESSGNNPMSITGFRNAEESPALRRQAVSRGTVLPNLAGDSHGDLRHSVGTNRDDHHQSQA